MANLVTCIKSSGVQKLITESVTYLSGVLNHFLPEIAELVHSRNDFIDCFVKSNINCGMGKGERIKQNQEMVLKSE